MPASHLYDDQMERSTRGYVLAIAVSAVFLTLILRLFYVQVIEAERNIRLSTENRMQLVELNAPRGRILDRNGAVLAHNRPSYSICVLPYKLKNAQVVMDRLCLITDTAGAPVFDREDLEDAIKRAKRRRFDLTRLKEDVSVELMSVVEEHSLDLPGIVVATESRREYPLGPAAFHAIGYLSEIPDKDFDSLRALGYAFGARVGKAGVERRYEDILRGTNGQEFVEVNAFGKPMGSIDDMPRIPPVPGLDITLGMDARLQKFAEESFPDSLRGAAVALDPRTGEVLMMVSHPSVDPNIFSLAANVRSKQWQAVALDSAQPLNNRATVGTYTPGSTFKLVTSLAGLASGKIGRDTHMPRACHGVYHFGRTSKACWNARGHGSVGVVGAIQQSCNVYYYQLGLLLGDSLINRYACQLGLCAPTGIDLPQERSSWPSGETAFNIRHKNRKFGKWVWTDGLLLDHAIGQTQSLSPIAMAGMVGALGMDGVRMKPHMLIEMRTLDGTVVQLAKPDTAAVLDVAPGVLDIVQEGMRKVLEPGGTAGASRVPCVVVGGKTGSAEWKKGEKTHGLFIACAPMDAPEIAIAVAVENAGHGGAVAAPIAGNILRYYFSEISPHIDCPEYRLLHNVPSKLDTSSVGD